MYFPHSHVNSIKHHDWHLQMYLEWRVGSVTCKWFRPVVSQSWGQRLSSKGQAFLAFTFVLKHKIRNGALPPKASVSHFRQISCCSPVRTDTIHHSVGLHFRVRGVRAALKPLVECCQRFHARSEAIDILRTILMWQAHWPTISKVMMMW